MALRHLDLRGIAGDRAALRAALPGPTYRGEPPVREVAAIIEEVRAGGDATLRRLTATLDGVEVDELRVPDAELDRALERIPSGLRSALEVAHDRIRAYHAHEAAPEVEEFATGGISVRHLTRPVARAGCYAPGGRARYPSTVLMCATPARVAGVAGVVLCTPPAPDGRVDDATLAAARLAGVDEVYRIGGAQAIAALAYGTASIEPVDVVVGPGNRYVAEAERQVAGVVGTPSGIAGPSEVVVIAGPDTPVELAAVDLVVQAEHGPDGLAWLVTWSAEVASAVVAEVATLVAASPRRVDLEATLAEGGIVALVDGPAEACAVANAVAPEHLEILTDDAEELLGSIESAGAVFLGPRATASFGDYLAGPNHVLPTNRSARFAERAPGRRLRPSHPRDLGEREGARDPRSSRRDPGRHRRAAGPRTIGALAMAGLARDGTEEDGRGLPAVRPDLAALTGYHSPQVEVEVRLNTNESPSLPPAGGTKPCSPASPRSPSTGTPTATPPSCAPRWPRATGSSRSRSSAPTAPTRSSSRCCSPTGGRAGGPRCSSPPTPCTVTSHGSPAPRSPPVAAGTRSSSTSPRCARCSPVRHRSSPSSARRTTRPGGQSRASDLEAVQGLAPGLVVVDEAYGQFAPWSALELLAEGKAGSERTVVVRTFSKTWSMAAGRLGYLIGPPEVVRACESVALPYHLDAVTQLAGRLALGFIDEMEARIALLIEERGRIAAALHDLPVEAWPSDANFLLFRPSRKEASEVWSDLLGASVLVRDCSSWPGLEGCLRVTVGLPEENDRFLAALHESLR